jgi:tetratricopeptide (TPR) repeat protein
MRRRFPLLFVAAVLLASPAWAVQEWYDHYLEARDRLIPEKRYAEALKSLQQALRLRSGSALNVQTYGLQFVDYLPYYYQGLCHLRLGDHASAIRAFDQELAQGAIKRSRQHKELVSLRLEAENARTAAESAERQRVARLARETANKLIADAEELARGRRFDEALAKLASAQSLAATLDPSTQRALLGMNERIRGEQRAAEEAASRARRLDAALAEGTRLLAEDRASEAQVRFDEALAVDPRNARALEGKARALERILASKTRAALEARFREGKALFEAGQIEKAIQPLTDAASDPTFVEAASLLARARATQQRVQREKELRERIEKALAEGERLLAARAYPEAQVQFEGALALDRDNLRARDRLAVAERLTGEALFARWLPNQPPFLTFLEPKVSEVEGPTVSFVGLATDDRGIARVEIRESGQTIARSLPQPSWEDVEGSRRLRFEKQVALHPGANEIVVVAVDTSGAERAESFRIVRILRFWETRAFVPSTLGTALALVALGYGVQVVRRRRAIRRRFNPYIAGAPVLDESLFFGREKLLARILNVLHHNSLMITGERRIGKTTFLYRLKRALEADDATEFTFFPVFSDLQGVTEEAFFHTVMADIVETLGLKPETAAGLRFRPSAVAYDGRDFSHDVRKVIEELGTRTPKKAKLALLIDEVDALNEFSERVNQRLRGIFMKTFSEHLVAIMSGVGIKRTWKSEGSPWYNFFDEIELTAFSRDEAEALVRRPVEGVFRYTTEAVERIIGLSELRPYVIQKFCIHAINRIIEQGRTTVTGADIEAVRADAVRSDDAPVEADGRQPGDRPQTVGD